MKAWNHWIEKESNFRILSVDLIFEFFSVSIFLVVNFHKLKAIKVQDDRYYDSSTTCFDTNRCPKILSILFFKCLQIELTTCFIRKTKNSLNRDSWTRADFNGQIIHHSMLRHMLSNSRRIIPTLRYSLLTSM